MKNRLLVLALSIAVLGVACGSSRPVASVNGVELDRAELLERLEAASPEPMATYDADLAASVASEFVADTIVDAELADRDVDASVIDDQLVIELAYQGAEPGSADELERTRRVVALAYSLAGVEPPNEERLRATFDQAPNAFVAGFCSQVILVADEATASDALDDLTGGASFESVLDDVTGDAEVPAGADLGCLETGSGSLPEEIEELLLTIDVGVWSGPFLTSIGYVDALVSERPTADYETARDSVRSVVVANDAQAVGEAYQAWQIQAFDDADIEFDDRDFGISPSEGLVIPDGVTEPQVAGVPTILPTP